MKKITLMFLAALTILSSCTKQDNQSKQGDLAMKSLEFTLGVTSPKTRMSDGSVTSSVVTAVRQNIQNITIEYYNASNVLLGTYNFLPAQIDKVKLDDQAGTRQAVRIENIPSATEKVNVYMNVKSATNINDLQTSYNVMEYSGSQALGTPAGVNKDNDNALYSVEVSVQPVLARFEFAGTVADITINQSGSGTLPTGFSDGTKLQAQAHVNEATITAAETAAKELWRSKNTGAAEPTWVFTYTVSYAYNTSYTISDITGYYMNNIPLTKTGPLVLNANDASGDWNTEAKERYEATNGTMKQMFDEAAPLASQRIVYNLFPQTFTPAGDKATLAEVKTHMPHFILKLTTSSGTRWITVRAFREQSTGTPLIDAFNAGKVYVLNATDINVTQYSAELSVNANGTKGPEVPEDKDPTDPNPEPKGKDLDLLVKILEWDVVNVTPEY